MVIIQSIVLTVRFFGFCINFSYIIREYFSLILIQNFFMTVTKLIHDIYNHFLGIFYPDVVYQGENRINYLSQDSFHKIFTFSITMIHQFSNLIIYILIFITNSYLLSIGIYYDELTLVSYYQTSRIILPTLYNFEQYNSLVLMVEDPDFNDFFNFMILFSAIYPIITSIPNKKENIKTKFIIIEGDSIPEKKDSLCSICWENSCNWSLPCKHQFHYDCIKEWHINKNKNTCPYCRCIIKKNYFIEDTSNNELITNDNTVEDNSTENNDEINESNESNDENNNSINENIQIENDRPVILA